jgi:hypothetical protein
MKTFSKLQRLIIRDLIVSSNGLHVYTIHRRYGISPALLDDSLDELLKNNLVELIEDKIKLTENGVERFKQAKGDFIRDSEKSWKTVPIEFTEPPLSINTPYVPRISLLDLKKFPFAEKWKKEKRNGGLH